jgi:hypothetical protein
MKLLIPVTFIAILIGVPHSEANEVRIPSYLCSAHSGAAFRKSQEDEYSLAQLDVKSLQYVLRPTKASDGDSIWEIYTKNFPIIDFEGATYTLEQIEVAADFKRVMSACKIGHQHGGKHVICASSDSHFTMNFETKKFVIFKESFFTLDNSEARQDTPYTKIGKCMEFKN